MPEGERQKKGRPLTVARGITQSSCSNRTRMASCRSFTVKPRAGVVKMVSSPAILPRMPSALPSESKDGRSAARRRGWYESPLRHRYSRYPAPNSSAGWRWSVPKLGRQAIDHFHFGVTGTYRAKFGEHAGNLRLVDILEALFLQRTDDLSCELNFSSLSSALNALTSSSCFAELRISHPDYGGKINIIMHNHEFLCK